MRQKKRSGFRNWYEVFRAIYLLGYNDGLKNREVLNGTVS